jgi:hypothetical protein
MWYATAWVAPEKGFAVLVTTNVAGEETAEGCNRAIGALVQFHLQGSAR